MKGFVQDIESLAVKNEESRRVLYTAKHCQLVVMANWLRVFLTGSNCLKAFIVLGFRLVPQNRL
jgi:hypothetical protein